MRLPRSRGERDVIEVARLLWDSWEDDTVIKDVTTGRYLGFRRDHVVAGARPPPAREMAEVVVRFTTRGCFGALGLDGLPSEARRMERFS